MNRAYVVRVIQIDGSSALKVYSEPNPTLLHGMTSVLEGDTTGETYSEANDRAYALKAWIEECEKDIVPSPTSHDTYSDELTGYEEHLRDSEFQGDPRRCPKHPHVATSSDDGMFDGVCGECESEGDEASYMWEHDASNTTRKACGFDVSIYATAPYHANSCQDAYTDADLCF